jgi:hypothetical protein
MKEAELAARRGERLLPQQIGTVKLAEVSAASRQGCVSAQQWPALPAATRREW